MDLNTFYDAEFDQHQAAMDATRGALAEPFARLIGVCDPLLLVPSDITSRIQEMHITLGHMLCGALEQELDLI